MKTILIFSALLISQVSFATETKCQNESIAAALKFVIDDYSLSLQDMTKFGVQEAGVDTIVGAHKKKKNLVQVIITNSSGMTNAQVLLDIKETYDNACETSNAQFVDEN